MALTRRNFIKGSFFAVLAAMLEWKAAADNPAKSFWVKTATRNISAGDFITDKDVAWTRYYTSVYWFVSPAAYKELCMAGYDMTNFRITA